MEEEFVACRRGRALGMLDDLDDEDLLLEAVEDLDDLEELEACGERWPRLAMASRMFAICCSIFVSKLRMASLVAR